MPETARQIADDLRARIDSGEFGPGARLPGEPALVKQYGVAKMTAANALKLLVTEGAAYARAGSGTYVRDFKPIRRVATRRLSQSARLADLGMAPVDFTEELRARMPSSEEAELLALLPATPLVEIYRTALNMSAHWPGSSKPSVAPSTRRADPWPSGTSVRTPLAPAWGTARDNSAQPSDRPVDRKAG